MPRLTLVTEREEEVYACLEIRFGGCVQIDLANGDVAMIPIEDREGCSPSAGNCRSARDDGLP